MNAKLNQNLKFGQPYKIVFVFEKITVQNYFLF
jgi:hypothetical protein